MAAWVVVVVLCTTGFWHVLGLRLAYPIVFADETTFMLHARACQEPEGSAAAALRSLSPVHSFLYSFVSEPGPTSVARVRLLNAFFCGLSVLPAWLLARRFVSDSWALIFAAVVGLNPWNSFSGNFMPESLYGFVFWWLAWAVIGTSTTEGSRLWLKLLQPAGVGVLAALLFFTKSHALTLIVVCALVYVLRAVRSLRAKTRSAGWPLLEGAGFLAAWLICLLLFGLIAKRSLIDLFYAGRYQGEAGGLLQIQDTLQMLRCFGRQLAGTAAHAGVLYAVPIGVTLAAIPRLWRASDPKSEGRADLVSFAVLAVGLTLFFSIKFISDQELHAQPELGRRLMERYYGHLLPLLVLVFLALRADRPSPAQRVAVAVVAAFAAIVLSGWHGTYTLSAYDTPSFYWINPFELEPRTLSTGWLAVVMAIAALPVVWFVAGARRIERVFLVAAIPLFSVAIYGAHLQLDRESRGLTRFHEYAAMTGHIIDHDWKHAVLIGDGFRTAAFQMMLNGTPHVLGVPEGQRLPAKALPPGTRWLILLHTPEPSHGQPSTVSFRGWAHGTVEIIKIEVP